MFWAFEKGVFTFFWKYLRDEVETIFWENETKCSKVFKSKFDQRKLLRKYVKSYLDLKSKCSECLKRAFFFFFYKFLSDEVETVFSEKEAKHLIIFKSKVGHRKLLRKWFWSYLDLKNECSEHLKWSFFSFLQIFEWWGQNHFPGK